MDWKSNFDERELEEIDFCIFYKMYFNHGTSGHNLRIIVAKMASILYNAESIINKEDEKFSYELHVPESEIDDLLRVK